MRDPYMYRDRDRDYFEGREYYDPYRYFPNSRGYDYGYGMSSGPYHDNDYYGNNMYYGSGFEDANRYGSGRDYDTFESPYYYGQYRGYGPKGYTRSDERIREDINERLTSDGRIDATDVNVAVTGGVVSLDGSVDDRQQKRIAEHIADSVSGVWDVDNHLNIRNRGGQRGNYRGFQGTASRGEIHVGMDVVGSQGQHIGTVKEVRASDFLADRPAARDIYIPFSACSVNGGQVRLNIRAGAVDKQGWPVPAVFGR